MSPVPRPPLVVRAITADEHRAWLDRRLAEGHEASFLQTPAWAAVADVPSWEKGSIGWLDPDGEVVGAALLVRRPVPRLRRWALAYVPEGPPVDLTGDPGDPGELARWLDPLVTHARSTGCFGLRLGPVRPVRTWSPGVVRAGAGDDAAAHLRDLDHELHAEGAGLLTHLEAAGWRRRDDGEGLGDGFPRHGARVPLTRPDGAPLDDDALRSGMNRLWRRSLARAATAGLSTTCTVPAPGEGRADLADLHRLYTGTAGRDGFEPWPMPYFTSLVDSFAATWPGCVRLWTTRLGDEPLAGLLTLHLGPVVHVPYGAASPRGLELRATQAAHLAAMRGARDAGARHLDLHGVSASLRAGDPSAGLLRFKAGLGAEVVERVGEWDLALRPLLHRAHGWAVDR